MEKKLRFRVKYNINGLLGFHTDVVSACNKTDALKVLKAKTGSKCRIILIEPIGAVHASLRGVTLAKHSNQTAKSDDERWEDYIKRFGYKLSPKGLRIKSEIDQLCGVGVRRRERN
jgi:hypothetical protein